MSLRITIPVALVNVVLSTFGSLAQDAPPRYKLQVGQEIQYRQSSESRFDAGGGYRFQRTWTLWVIGHHSDGRWRVIEQYAIATGKLDGGLSQPETKLGRCDVFPDSRIEGAQGGMAVYEPLPIFPKLPREATVKNWETMSPTFEYSAQPRDAAGDFVFRFDDRRALNWQYLIQHSGTFHFDVERGLVRSASDDWDQGYPRHSKGPGTLSLSSIQMKDDAFVTQLSRESGYCDELRQELQQDVRKLLPAK